MKILLANPPFIRLGSYRAQQLAEDSPSLAGVPLQQILPQPICAMTETAHTSGEDTEREGITLEGVPYTLSVFSIRRGELTLLLLRSLAEADIRIELTARLQQTAGLDLVTEGLLTLSKVPEILENHTDLPAGRGQAYHVCKLLLASDRIGIVIGMRRSNTEAADAETLILRRKVLGAIARTLETRFAKQVVTTYL